MSPASRRAQGRPRLHARGRFGDLDRIHGHYDIPPDELASMDEPLRRARGMPGQPARFVASVYAGLRPRARVLLFLPPRRTAYGHRPSTYPHGYRLADLGPVSMLDEINPRERTG